jgi:hypothetical protein
MPKTTSASSGGAAVNDLRHSFDAGEKLGLTIHDDR